MAGKTTSKPGIVFYNRVYAPVRGASGRVLRDLAHGFAEAGWAVTVVTTGPARKTEMDGPVKVIRVKASLRAKKMFGYGLVWLKMLFAGLRLPEIGRAHV